MSKWTEYIGSQFGNPRGLIGSCCCVIMNVMNRPMYSCIVRRLRLQGESRVLDIGYGNGYLAQKIYGKCKSYVYGIDISEDMKVEAEKRNRKAVEAGKIRLMTGDCCKLEFKDNYFDAVTSVNTVYFWRDVNQGMSEVCRVLKSGGIFYNVVYSKDWLQKLSYTRKGFNFFEKTELEMVGRRAGFKSVAVKDVVPGKSYMVMYRK